MRQWPPRTLLTRTLLWSIFLAMFAFATFGKPVSWAAPVTAPRNQTMPPVETLMYLPKVSLTLTSNDLIGVLKGDGRFSTLLKSLDAANLTAALEGSGPWTMFAPTDAAFAGLPLGVLEQLLANPTGQLTQILLYHIVPGEYEIDNLENGMEIITQQGKPLFVENENGEVLINSARILTPTLEASNGVIHAIEVVLLPPPD